MVPSLLPKRKSSAPELDLESKKSKLGENFDPVVLENISSSMLGQEQNNGKKFNLIILNHTNRQLSFPSNFSKLVWEKIS